MHPKEHYRAYGLGVFNSPPAPPFSLLSVGAHSEQLSSAIALCHTISASSQPTVDYKCQPETSLLLLCGCWVLHHSEWKVTNAVAIDN